VRSYTSNRLHFLLLMSLGASKSLRRWWFLGTTILLVLSVWGLYYHAQHEVAWALAAKARGASADVHQLTFYACWIGFLTSISGYVMWLIAHIIRFFGKHVKDDYRDDKLFER
jgi:hypothetical protein